MSFVTGSHAYGKVHKGSDIDLVIRVSAADLERLRQHATNDGRDYGVKDGPCVSIRFGKLNLLCCLTDTAYGTWRLGTKKLKKRKPVERFEAVEMFKQLRKERGQ